MIVDLFPKFGFEQLCVPFWSSMRVMAPVCVIAGPESGVTVPLNENELPYWMLVGRFVKAVVVPICASVNDVEAALPNEPVAVTA